MNTSVLWASVRVITCAVVATAAAAVACGSPGEWQEDTASAPATTEAAVTALPGPLEPPPIALPPPPAPGCADGTAEQVFAGGIVGCAGSVTYPNRATLCAPGFHVLNAMIWKTSRGATVPTHHYWTNEPLVFKGTGTGACSAEYAGGFSCPADQPMRVCASTTTDPEGNQCNWYNCAFDSGSNSPNDYMGGCAGNATAGTLCVPDSGCADGTVEQTFTRGMVGCAGFVAYANAESLCSAGYKLAYDSDWLRYRAGAAPTHNYWTASPPTHYRGSSSSCVASHAAADPACPADTPMRVCVPGGNDPDGNHCNWSNCDNDDFYSTTTNEYFGGCIGNTTAGALCVPYRMCADGTIDQQWNRFYIGCAGSVTFPDRDSLCGPRQIAISSSLWGSTPRTPAPTHNYWTSDALKYSGTGPFNCAVSTTSGFNCPTNQPMHLCTASGDDPEGNHCNWSHCGLNATMPDALFGGCGATAGTVCMTGP